MDLDTLKVELIIVTSVTTPVKLEPSPYNLPPTLKVSLKIVAPETFSASLKNTPFDTLRVAVSYTHLTLPTICSV